MDISKDDFLNRLVVCSEHERMLDDLRKETLPLVIWGRGSMSVSVKKVLDKMRIAIDAYWVDGCDRNEIVNGIPIMSLEDIKEKFKEINVVFGHSKYELRDDIVNNNPFIKKCYCLVNVCYGQWRGINYDFVYNHSEEYIKTYLLLSDEKSRDCMIAYLNCKLTENFEYLLPCCDEKATYFRNPFFMIQDDENYVDIGAYDGDSIEEFLRETNVYSNIYAIEPEEINFKKLKDYICKKELKNVELYKCGCWDRNTTISFMENYESSGIDLNGNEELEVHTLDTLLDNREISLIKINYLSGVVETLKGAANILKLQQPKLAITVGFDEWGIIKVPQIIKSINPQYRIFLRYAAAMPARLILFAY